VALTTDQTLPPGEADVIERLLLDGRFDLDSARFTDPDIQSKLAGMSQRARGRDPDARAGAVASEVEGRFMLKRSVLALSKLSYRIPGARVRLDGSYGLSSEAIDFEGDVRLDATVSQAVGAGGVKGFLLKAVDPLFRKGKAGAVVPIRVRGTRSDPRFGLDVRRTLGQIVR
jgi:hypothetical protein